MHPIAPGNSPVAPVGIRRAGILLLVSKLREPLANIQPVYFNKYQYGGSKQEASTHAVT